MNSNQTNKIKHATHDDINLMIAICEENLVANNREKFSADDFSKKGFLVRKLTFLDAKEMIDDQKNFLCLILKNGDEALGYLTGCDIKKTPDNFQEIVLHAEELKEAKGKIFYHRQIAKKAGGKNIGKELLLAMLDEAKSRGYRHVVCKIVHQPFYNEASIGFHEKFGFKKISSIAEDGMVLGIYLKTI